MIGLCKTRTYSVGSQEDSSQPLCDPGEPAAALSENAFCEWPGCRHAALQPLWLQQFDVRIKVIKVNMISGDTPPVQLRIYRLFPNLERLHLDMLPSLLPPLCLSKFDTLPPISWSCQMSHLEKAKFATRSLPTFPMELLCAPFQQGSPA